MAYLCSFLFGVRSTCVLIKIFLLTKKLLCRPFAAGPSILHRIDRSIDVRVHGHFPSQLSVIASKLS